MTSSVKEEQIGPYKKGDTVVCIINSRASLTIGKEYHVMDVYGSSKSNEYDISDNITLVIKSDVGLQEWYDHMRFLPKSEFRNQLINQIL